MRVRCSKFEITSTNLAFVKDNSIERFMSSGGYKINLAMSVNFRLAFANLSSTVYR